MRHFTDSTGVEWTVFEVARTERQAKWSYLPDEYCDGWLCFESKVSKRRLTMVPRTWREASHEQLERMLGEAVPVGRKTREDELRE